MKEIKIEVPEGYEIDRENSTFETIKFKEKSKLPMSWKELGDITGYYIDSTSSLKNCYGYSGRGKENLWPTLELAEAALALSQLLQLRDRWNGDWKPDWNTLEEKYIICLGCNGVGKYISRVGRYILTLKDESTRDLFFVTFRDLIETAKPLL